MAWVSGLKAPAASVVTNRVLGAAPNDVYSSITVRFGTAGAMLPETETPPAGAAAQVRSTVAGSPTTRAETCIKPTDSRCCCSTGSSG